MTPSPESGLLSRALTLFGVVFVVGPPIRVPPPCGPQPGATSHLDLVHRVVQSGPCGRQPIHSVTDPGQLGHLWEDVAGLVITAAVLAHWLEGSVRRRPRGYPAAAPRPA